MQCVCIKVSGCRNIAGILQNCSQILHVSGFMLLTRSGNQVCLLYHSNSAGGGADITVVSAFMLRSRKDSGSTHSPVCSGFIQSHQTDAETAPQTALQILTNTLTASLNTQSGYKF